MEILDPDLWNDDGTPKKPSKTYMASLAEAQRAEALEPETPHKRAEEQHLAYIDYVAAKRCFKQQTPPTIGDMVHFWGGKEDPAHDHCFAAIVMEVDGQAATLRVHVPHEAFMDWHVDHDEDKGHDTWHWPEDGNS